MLRLENITKRFGPVVANDRISLEVRAGEVLALLGENGAGKTTLVSLLYGLYAPDEGRILLEGRPVQIPSPKAAQALGIALVPQHPELIEAHTVAENLALGLDLPFLLPRRALVRRLKALLAGHPLGVDLEAPVHLLSAGEKQRVEILRALLAKPKVLILDEPTSVLTPQEAEGLFQEIARYKAMGLAVIFISHKLDEVLRVADRIAVLRGGEKGGGGAEGEGGPGPPRAPHGGAGGGASPPRLPSGEEAPSGGAGPLRAPPGGPGPGGELRALGRGDPRRGRGGGKRAEGARGGLGGA